MEQRFCKAKVEGSNPFPGSSYHKIRLKAEVAERSIARDCKSLARKGYIGSNPVLSTLPG